MGVSVHYDCLQAVKAKLLAKVFAYADAPSRVLLPTAFQVRMLPRAGENLTALPAVLICPVGAEKEEGTLLNHDDIGYPVAVVIVAAADFDFTTNQETFLSWRQTIYRAFRNQRLDGVPGVRTTKTWPDVVFDPEAFSASYIYSGLLFRFISREQRG